MNNNSSINTTLFNNAIDNTKSMYSLIEKKKETPNYINYTDPDWLYHDVHPADIYRILVNPNVQILSSEIIYFNTDFNILIPKSKLIKNLSSYNPRLLHSNSNYIIDSNFKNKHAPSKLVYEFTHQNAKFIGIFKRINLINSLADLEKTIDNLFLIKNQDQNSKLELKYFKNNKKIQFKKDIYILSNYNLLISFFYDVNDEKLFHDFLKKFTKILYNIAIIFEKVNEDNRIPINIIGSKREGTYNLQKIMVSYSSLDENTMNLHYGENFSKFNNKLLNLIKEKTKGIVLLHGPRGTGKTTYIRNLINDLHKHKKIIYLGSDFVAEFLNSIFISFLIDTVKQSNENILLILEDAESLLKSRENSTNFNSAMSNLLNISDGLLNDSLGIQIIATFNTSDLNIDSALERPGRLIGKHFFDNLNELQIKKIVNYYGIDESLIKDKNSASLAELLNINESPIIG